MDRYLEGEVFMKFSKEIVVRNQYLNLPVKNMAPKLKTSFVVEGEAVREFETELANGKPDFWFFSHIGKYEDVRLRVQFESQPSIVAPLNQSARAISPQGLREPIQKEISS